MPSADPRPAPEASLDASGRPLRLRDIDWATLFRPTTVVVVGASETEGSQQRAQFTQIRDRLGAHGADVVPIHPTRETVLGTRAYANVRDVPGPIDVAIVLVRDPLPIVEDCAARDVKFVVVFSAGFSEVGTEEGRAAEARLEELASGAMRVIGPNTNLNIFEPWRDDIPGKKLAVITQSGMQGRPITQGQELGIAIQRWATLGNEADVEFADLVGYFCGLPDTGAIATFAEGFKDGRTLQLAADVAAARGVPIVCIKVGRSEQGEAMARAHTGHLTGADAVHDAVFRQRGVIRVDDLDELIEISGMFCHTELIDGPGGIVVYALSGGTASHTADLCGVMGVPIPKLEQRTIDGLGQILPWFLRHDNPVDTGGTFAARPEGRRILDLMIEDGNTDILFAPITGVFPGMSDALSRDLIELHREGRKPIVVAWLSPLHDDAYRALCEAGVPLFHSFGAAIKGMKALAEFSAFVRNYESPFAVDAEPESAAAAPARALLVPGRATNEVESKAVLRAYGIPTVEERVATTATEAVTAAQALGLPVVMKILSADIAHKSDLGLVEIGVATTERVRAIYDRLLADAQRFAPDAEIDGVLVQPMITGAVAEVILGLSHQAPFGPTITYGLGGVLTEVYKDVAFAVPPFSEADARAMVDSTKSAAILRGVRGRPAGDIDALIAAIMRLQRLAVEIGDEISELDINPLLVLPARQGVLAVDALVVARTVR
ncbi:MAG: CoA-binding domain protein [Actinomycetia bacterium]|nr:CoA-binding domain protein [Actinomycetes bacterium]